MDNMDDQLADPSDMSSQQRTDELVKAVQEDDLVGLLLYQAYSVLGEQNGRATSSGKTPLEAALTTPIRRLDVRQLVLECLLHHGVESAAEVALTVEKPVSQELLSVVKEWDRGGRERASLSHHLRHVPIEEAEVYIQQNGLDVEDLPPAPSTSSAVLPPPRPSFSPRRGRSPSPTARERSHPPSTRRSRSPRHRSFSPESSQRRNSPRYRSASRTRRHDELRDRPSHPPPRRPSSPPPRRQTSRHSSPRVREMSPAGSAKPSFPPASSHWIYITEISTSRSERFIIEKLARRGIECTDVFLTVTGGGTKRQAFVGLHSEVEASEAIEALGGLAVDGKILRATHFRDPQTGSAFPRILVQPERRYVGAREQSRRPPNLRRLGLFILHLPPTTVKTDIVRFLERSIRSSDIRNILIKYAGHGTHAFVDLDRVQAGQRAIFDLDGELIGGAAVRVAWNELDGAWMARALQGTDPRPPLPPHRGQVDLSSSPSRPFPSDHPALSSTNLQPLTKNRYAALAGSSHPPATAASPTEALPTPAPDPSSPHNPPRRPSISTVEATPSLPPPDSASPSKVEEDDKPKKDEDLALLESLDLPASTVEGLKKCWDAYDEAPFAEFRRVVEGEVSFGFLASDRAKAVLEANEREPAYPGAPVMQNRWEAFLKAQTGESKDWYTVFFAKLMQFNAEAKEFSQMAKEAAKGRRATSGMEVEEG